MRVDTKEDKFNFEGASSGNYLRTRDAGEKSAAQRLGTSEKSHENPPELSESNGRLDLLDI